MERERMQGEYSLINMLGHCIDEGSRAACWVCSTCLGLLIAFIKFGGFLVNMLLSEN
jgi:hypothetical protein